MKRSEYLRRFDKVKVAQNHSEHPNRTGWYHSMFARSPKGTKEIYDYVRFKADDNEEWVAVRFEYIIKMVDGKPVPFVEPVEDRKKKPKKKARKIKESYPDRVIDWGQWLRYDLNDGTTIVKPHSSVSERYANTDFEAQLNSEKKLKKRWPKHTGYVVRPKYGDEDSWIFVNSLDEAESCELPFQPMFEMDEGSEEEIAFEPYF